SDHNITCLYNKINERRATQANCKRRKRQEPDVELVRAQETAAKPAYQEQDKIKRRLARNKNCIPSSCSEALGFTRDFPLELDVGKIDIECRHCGALHFQGEQTGKDLDQFIFCCYKGTVVLLSLLPFLDELKLLFLRNYPLSKPFHEHIRKYNGALAFASIVSNIEKPSGCGPYIYKISEQIYHFLGPAQPNANEVPTFGQLYFMETADTQMH
ncbi:20798_t:CDS:2, partial [Dentiscutata erythropus]